MAYTSVSLPLPLSLLLLFLLAFIFHHYPCAARIVAKYSSDLEDQVCRKTDDYAFCVSALDTDTRTPGTDLAGLAQISLDLTRHNITNTQNYINTQGGLVTDSSVKQDFQACFVIYDAAYDATLRATRDLLLHDYPMAGEEAGEVIGRAADCENIFQGKPAILAEYNANVKKLAASFAVVAEMLRDT